MFYQENSSKVLDLLKEIAREAGSKILSVYESKDEQKIIYKEDESPLTLADKLSNEHIITKLQENFPQVKIISEENKTVSTEERQSYDCYWLVDPLDGTKEFIKRNGEFTVNIALVNKNTPVLGVIYVPVQDIMYWASYQEGAYKQEGKKEPQKIQAASFQKEDKGLFLVCSRSHLNEETKNFLAQFIEPQTVSMGSSLKFMLVAEGKAHVYPRLAPTMEWDTAAAQIIVEEAGGKVLAFPEKTPLVYNKNSLRNPSFLVYGNGSLGE